MPKVSAGTSTPAYQVASPDECLKRLVHALAVAAARAEFKRAAAPTGSET
jgi:hypothetical protein